MPKEIELEMFECRERVRPILEEFLDDWMIVGRRAGTKQRVIIGINHGGWKDLQEVYEQAKNWKKKTDPVEHP